MKMNVSLVGIWIAPIQRWGYKRRIHQMGVRTASFTYQGFRHPIHRLLHSSPHLQQSKTSWQDELLRMVATDMSAMRPCWEFSQQSKERLYLDLLPDVKDMEGKGQADTMTGTKLLLTVNTSTTWLCHHIGERYDDTHKRYSWMWSQRSNNLTWWKEVPKDERVRWRRKRKEGKKERELWAKK